MRGIYHAPVVHSQAAWYTRKRRGLAGGYERGISSQMRLLRPRRFMNQQENEMTITTKKRLRESLEDLAQGAMGHCEISLDEGDDNLEGWFRWIMATKKRYAESVHPYTFELYNLAHFETMSGAVDHLWEARVRR